MKDWSAVASKDYFKGDW